MELGLKRGTVRLVEHQSQWEEDAKDVIKLLKQILGETAVDIQHVGSTAIPSIHAKPIVDIAVAVRSFDGLQPYVGVLERRRIGFRGKVVDGDILFVMGEKDMRTHHIHVVQWNGPSWNHYIAFRDHLNAHPEKAMLYDAHKQRLAAQFSGDRIHYTAGKEPIIQLLLAEAERWKQQGAGKAD